MEVVVPLFALTGLYLIDKQKKRKNKRILKTVMVYLTQTSPM